MIDVTTYVELADGALTPVEDAAALPDPFYVEGALLLAVDGHRVMDFDLADDVLSLWYDLANLVTGYLARGTATTMLPDQPVELSMHVGDSDDDVRWSITNVPDPSTTVMNLVELLDALASGAAHFFGELSRLRPDETDTFNREAARWPALAQRGRHWSTPDSPGATDR